MGLDIQNIGSNERTCVWKKPPSGNWVLSCDGSMMSNRMGYGGLLRDDAGFPLFGFAGTSTMKHVLWLEIFILHKGLILAPPHGVPNLIIYMDSQLTMKILHEKACCPWRFVSLRRKISKLLLHYDSYLVIHVWREVNQPADNLAA